MTVLRHILMRHRVVASWLIVLALLMRMLVPSGYMIGASAGAITIELCGGYGPVKVAKPAHGMAHHQDKRDHQEKEMPPCAFSGLSAPSLGGADPLLLATAIAFILVTVFRVPARAAVPDAPAFLRPPLRGPPARI